ncbi:MAG: lytic murein transglycosylase [Alphaproteobacteria bacterium]|nr:lytic murein transglycosylase [Alphaproteobacteria bacterium]
MTRPFHILLLLGLLGACAAPSSKTEPPAAGQATEVPGEAEAPKPEFTAWLAEFRAKAKSEGIGEVTLIAALDNVRTIPRVVELDKAQPEFKLTYRKYMERVVPLSRVEKGRKLLKTHDELLREISRKYNVPARFIVALWGIETDFGRVTGGFPVIPALVTLAYEGRRAAFFKGELMDALRILDQGHITPKAMSGSWAGAMGQVQFMPSSFLKFAVDEDGDGKRDIWGSVPDALGSAANYLSKSGWRDDVGWGRAVMLPQGFDSALLGLETRKTLEEWAGLGVLNESGQPLPKRNLTASIVQPQKDGDDRFLAYDNYRVIMKWNRSHYFALAVGQLADRLGSP